MWGYCLFFLLFSLCGVYTQQFSTPPTQNYYYNEVLDETCKPCVYTDYAPLTTCQQVITSPVCTTIIDNSVSYALANAIQLLIVSNLVESTMACKRCKNIVEEGPECDGELTEIVYDVPCGVLPDSLCSEETQIASVSDVSGVSPCLAEALFPSSIPAQLVCNFGYAPEQKPCVRFNVEPVSKIEPCSKCCN